MRAYPKDTSTEQTKTVIHLCNPRVGALALTAMPESH